MLVTSYFKVNKRGKIPENRLSSKEVATTVQREEASCEMCMHGHMKFTMEFLLISKHLLSF